jgi:hypothetical protein
MKSVTASEAPMSSKDARRKDVSAEQQPEKIVAHELEEGGV